MNLYLAAALVFVGVLAVVGLVWAVVWGVAWLMHRRDEGDWLS